MYTDFFGQQIDVGDEVVWPTATYSNPHAIKRGPITEIVPLVPHRVQNSLYHGANRYMRADQANKPDPTFYPEPSSPDKAFIAKVLGSEYLRKPKTTTIRNASSLIKVPAGA